MLFVRHWFGLRTMPMTALSGLQQNHWRITENSIIDRYFLPEKTPTRRFGDPPAVDFRFITAPRGGFAAAPEHHRNWCQTIQNLHPTRTSVIIRSAQAPDNPALRNRYELPGKAALREPGWPSPTGRDRQAAPQPTAPQPTGPDAGFSRRPPPAPRQRATRIR